MLELVPAARVAHIGLYRDPDTLTAVEYYFKAPADLDDRLVIVIEPILATGNTAVAAIERLKERGAKQIRFVCLICARQGIDQVRSAHPDVKIWTAAGERASEMRTFGLDIGMIPWNIENVVPAGAPLGAESRDPYSVLWSWVPANASAFAL